MKWTFFSSFTAIPLGETRPISIVTTATGKPDAPCRIFAKGPTSPYIEIPTKKTRDGYEAQYTPDEPGPNAVKVEFAEKEVSKTPFIVNVETEIDETKVQLKGLESRKCLSWNVIFWRKLKMSFQRSLTIISMVVY